MPDWVEFKEKAERLAREAAARDVAEAHANGPSPGLAGLMQRAVNASQRAGRPVSVALSDGEETDRGD